MHRQGCCHRDLKPDNIIVNVATCTLKVVDFNKAVRTSPQYLDDIRGGTGLKEWSAPETRAQYLYSAKCDSWSAGCVLFYMLTQG